MYSHLSTSGETGLNTSLPGVFAQTTALQELNALQVAAELWVERDLHHLNTCLTDRLNTILSQPLLSESIAEQLLQILVDHLSEALADEAIAVVEPTSNPISPALFEVSYTASVKAPSNCLTRADRALKNSAITETTLRQWQTQDCQGAWQMCDRAAHPLEESPIRWLIALAAPLVANSTKTVYLQARSTLVSRAIAQGMQAIHQGQWVQQLRQQNHRLQAQNRELIQITRLKSEFLANTSHEICTPLSSILGFTHLLREQGYNPGSARHQEYLKIILSSGQHLLALINDILDLSKIEADQLDLQCETVDVLSLCQTALKLVQEKANDKGLALRLEVSPGVNTIVADPLRLKQMLFNLLSNALKFTACGTVGLQVQAIDEALTFTVWDTGTGISKEQQQLLFRPYTQLTNAVQGEGTGLGLALTQKLAELHGGWVKVQSQLNQGSRFTIGLPFAPAPQAEVQQPSMAPQPPQTSEFKPQNSPLTTDFKAATPHSFTLPVKDLLIKDKRLATARAYNVLLVEDNVHNARLLITYLCKLGYEVTWAKNSSEMWHSLKHSSPALILMDIHLPGADGLVLTKQLQSEENYRSIPVIIQTAMAMKGDRERCLASGAIDYVTKPIDLAVLAQMVAKYSGMEGQE